MANPLSDILKNEAPLLDDELEKLRALLLTKEQNKIAEVEECLYNPVRHAEEVSHIIAEAILIRTSKDKALAQALQPILEEAIRTSIRNDPKYLVNALFPIMGPAIRKAIVESLRSMMQSLSQSLKYAFSWQGMRWRLESIRTGKSFAEIVLLHTLVYSIDQIFLIHKETGLLLTHVSRADAQVKDTDLVSSMLTAIQDFISDSFSTQSGQALDTLQIGDLTVWIERGSQSVLAVTITGNPPLEARIRLTEVLEKIETDYCKMLNYYQGDSSPFQVLIPLLETHLQEVRTESGKNVAFPNRVGKPFDPYLFILWTSILCLVSIAIIYAVSR